MFLVLVLLGTSQVWAGDLVGTLMNPEEKPISNALVTVKYSSNEIRSAVTNKDGKFRIQAAKTGPATLTFEAHGYSTLEEKGIKLEGNMDLSRTLQEKSAQSLWTLLLFVPGVLGLAVATGRRPWRTSKVETDEPEKKGKPASEKEGEKSTPENKLAESGSTPSASSDKFRIALLNASIWAVTLAVLAVGVGFGSQQGASKLALFHSSLAFEFYVPVLGFFGALLYVFDLYRKDPEDIPKGQEFGMRLIMAPYVAIIMVVLFGRDLNFVDLTAPTGKAALAFFSGLLVVVALQGLIERGNEWLGRWRRQRTGYQPSEVAKKFGLDEDDDLKLRKAGIRFLVQLREQDVAELREKAKKVEFDESLMVGLKKKTEEEEVKLEEQHLNKAIGDLVWKRLKKIDVDTVQEFAHLTDPVLQNIAEQEPPIVLDDLKTIRGQARKLVNAGM
jgi:hypothetical protein